MQKRKRTGNRTGAAPCTLRCVHGHVIQLMPHSTVPPCGAGPRGMKCGAVDFHIHDAA